MSIQHSPWLLIGSLLALSVSGCFRVSYNDQVLSHRTSFHPATSPELSGEYELVVRRPTRMATLKRVLRCDGEHRDFYDVEITRRTSPSIATYIGTGLLTWLGVYHLLLNEENTTIPGLILIGGAAGIIVPVSLSSKTHAPVRTTQRSTRPARNQPCGGKEAPDEMVRVGLGASGVDLISDENGQVLLPHHWAQSPHPPAAFVGGDSIQIRFEDEAPPAPTEPSGASQTPAP